MSNRPYRKRCRGCGALIDDASHDGIGADLCDDCFDAMLHAVGQPKPHELAEERERQYEADMRRGADR